MYLVFKMHKKGYPVNEIYEQEVKPISTRRFNNESIKENGGDIENMIEHDNSLGESYIKFESEASYIDLGLEKVQPKPKPDFVPGLNLFGLPEYVSSDEEEEQN